MSSGMTSVAPAACSFAISASSLVRTNTVIPGRKCSTCLSTRMLATVSAYVMTTAFARESPAAIK